MRKGLLTFFAFLCVVVLLACTTQEARLKESGLTPMTQTELDHLFSKPLELSFTSPKGDMDIKYADGKCVGTGRWGSGKGTYEIKNGLYCSRWDFHDMKEKCFKVYKISEAEYHFIAPETGILEGKAALK